MASRRIGNILKKEWQVMASDLNSLLLVTLLPLLIVGQAIFYIWLADHFGSGAILTNVMFQSALEKLRQALPATAGLPDREQLQVLLLSQFNFFLLGFKPHNLRLLVFSVSILSFHSSKT